MPTSSRTQFLICIYVSLCTRHSMQNLTNSLWNACPQRVRRNHRCILLNLDGFSFQHAFVDGALAMLPPSGAGERQNEPWRTKGGHQCGQCRYGGAERCCQEEVKKHAKIGHVSTMLRK